LSRKKTSTRKPAQRKQAPSVLNKPKGTVTVDDPTTTADNGAQPRTPSELDPSKPFENGEAPTALDFALLRDRVSILEGICQRLILLAPTRVQAEFSAALNETPVP
jgi:hypothetical protein